ncbi:MAG: iron ABC transporter permease [Fimbriimonadaceae bacterium]|nr:iron ABC transporter permease [Fimbriimonadaceae bacterium]
MSRAESEGPQRKAFLPVRTLVILCIVAILAFCIHIGAGSSDSHRLMLRLTPVEVVQEILRGDTDSGEAHNVIVWRLRLPRALACALVGALLGIVGSAFQGLFRNPLADPYIVGVSSGAAVGGAAALLLGIAGLWGGLAMMALAFMGGVLTLLLVFGLARTRQAVDVQRLLLAGVVVGAMLSAILTLMLALAGQDTNQMLRWLLGSMTPMTWTKLAILSGALVLGVVPLLGQAKALNAFAMGEETAHRLGVPTKRLKTVVLGVGTAMTAVCVGAVGIIGFLGLVSPHVARRLVGVDWRWSMIASGLVGVFVLCFADVLAQWGVPGGELPVGVITALVGAPFLLALLKRG